MADTQRIGLRIDTDAIELLSRLAPSPNKRGQYVSDLIRKAAREAGEPLNPADLDKEVERLAAELAAVQRRLRQQARQETGQGGA